MKTPLLPEQASNFAAEYDALFFTLSALTVFFTVLVGALVLFFSIRYRRGAKVNRAGAVDSHLGAELTWTIIPLILGLMMFWWSAKLFIKTRTPPTNATEVFVVAKQWMWQVQHDNGVRENNELHVPLGVPIRLTMISQDVIHSFFIPQFRIKQDVLPGRYTQQWFIPTKVGKYNLFCAEYCGTSHSEMGGYVYVMEPRDFEQWLARGGAKDEPPTMTMEQAGQKLYEKNACANCHTLNDTARSPSLYGLIGRKRVLDDGRTIVADEDYIRESLVDPYAKIPKGYEKTMPGDYKKQFTEEQILQLIAYMKTLGTAANPVTPVTNAPNARGGGR